MKHRPESRRWAIAALVAGGLLGATSCAQDVILGEQITLPPPGPALSSTSRSSETLESSASLDAGVDSSQGWSHRDDFTGTDTMWGPPHPRPDEEFPPGPDRPRPGETSADHRSDESNPDFMFPPRTDQILPDFTFEPPTVPGPDFSGDERSDAQGSSEF